MPWCTSWYSKGQITFKKKNHVSAACQQCCSKRNPGGSIVFLVARDVRCVLITTVQSWWVWQAWVPQRSLLKTRQWVLLFASNCSLPTHCAHNVLGAPLTAHATKQKSKKIWVKYLFGDRCWTAKHRCWLALLTGILLCPYIVYGQLSVRIQIPTTLQEGYITTLAQWCATWCCQPWACVKSLDTNSRGIMCPFWMVCRFRFKPCTELRNNINLFWFFFL